MRHHTIVLPAGVTPVILHEEELQEKLFDAIKSIGTDAVAYILDEDGNKLGEVVYHENSPEEGTLVISRQEKNKDDGR